MATETGTFAKKSILRRIIEKKEAKENFQDHSEHTDYDAYSDYDQHEDYNEHW